MPFNSKTYSCGSSGRVRRLDDLNHGQANWVNVPVPDAASNFLKLLDIEVSLNNGDHVFAVGPGTGSLGAPIYAGVAVSTNGGVTWNYPAGNYSSACILTINSGRSFQWNEIVVVGPQVYGISGMSVIVGSINILNFHGTIAISMDGGASYNLVNWFNNLPQPSPSMRDMDCTSVSFPNVNLGVVALNSSVSSDSWVIKTIDAGVNWTILNGATALSTTCNGFCPPGTLLPTHAITGISILASSDHIIGVCQDFIVETIPVSTGSGLAGVVVNSWRNNFYTSSGVGPPVYGGFSPNLSIGWHLNMFPVPDDRVIYISGYSELGIHSTDHGQSGWTVTPPPGWDPSNNGYDRKAAHFYLWGGNLTDISGFYNKSIGASNNVYWNNAGFAPPFEILSDDLPGLNYTPEAIWTWYQALPNCYTLTDCVDGSTISTNTNLQPYLGQVIAIAEQPGHCFVVSDGCVQVPPPILVTFVTAFVDCITCSPPLPSPCACPQGTILVTLPDGTQVCQKDTISLAQGPNQLFACQLDAVGINNPIATTPALLFGPSPQYCKNGAKFFNASGASWPITFNTGCTLGTQQWIDNSAVPLIQLNSASNTAWGTGVGGLFGPWDGRFNIAGVTIGKTPCQNDVTFGKYGFLHCMTVLTPTTYSFGFAGMGVEILINGIELVTGGNSDIYQYENWTVFQVTLPAGNYIIQGSCGSGQSGPLCGGFTFNNPAFTPRNPGSVVGFGFEIYNATIAVLAAMTTAVQVNAVLEYSTKDEDNKKYDYGELDYNYRCPCSLLPPACPTSFGNFGVIKPALDNCTVNLLNPNANPAIYVCHDYTYTAITGCCYILIDCQNPSITYITSTDLSIYVSLGSIITIAEYPGCFIVTKAPDCPQPAPLPVTVTGSFADCPTCLPKCYQLVDCDGVSANIITSTDLSIYVSQIINIVGSNSCWSVTLAQGCSGAITVTVVGGGFATCAACKPVCYQLMNCVDQTDIKITNTDLSAVLDQVIFIKGCPGTCWVITLAVDCVGAVPIVLTDTFADCKTCLNVPPPPPLELHPRKIKPGYDTKGCPPEYTERISCNFAKAAYDNMVIKRYGVTMCCNFPIQPWDIKKQLLELSAIYDPDICKNTFCKCCPPCAIVTTITPYPVITCDPPTNVAAVITIPPSTCVPPTNIQAAIIINPKMPCICYIISLFNPGAPCIFDYTDCNGVAQSATLFLSSTYICSITVPTTTCIPSNYMLQTTLANCLAGECHS